MTKETQARDIIAKIDPDRENIPENMTIGELRERMQDGEKFYDIMNVDSMTREKMFDAIAETHDIDYEEIYRKRMDEPEDDLRTF